ncbi:MAG: cupredoxin family copper-binding protein [Chloroflexota bacterium]|nr:cupredoxin family copper-binding protein [Chloroflexota bacterium]
MYHAGRRWTPILVAAALVVVGGLSGAAQDATPAAAGHDHPVHIHLGSCDNLDPNPTFMLTDIIAPAASSTESNGPVAIPVEESITTVDATLDDLRTGGYAINAHESVANIGTYIACGNLTSATTGDTLTVGLGELNDSGHAGIALLTANGEQTDVHVYLAEGLAGSAAAAQAATAPATADAAADAVQVDIKDLAFTPAQITVPVGGTVTWTNDDTVPHTATAKDRALLQSGTLEAGAQFSQTFDTPGTIDYFCEFHANMKGEIIVQ